jgi:predicted DsbA family dithiol-disulfide isomerase
MSQSTRAHRLAIKASKMGGQQLQLPILCALFKANLEEGRDIADVNVLADLATNVGMMSKDEVGSQQVYFWLRDMS